VTHPAFGGRGIASQVVGAALAHVQQEGTRQVVPQCSFVVTYLERHPELRDVLEPRPSGL
jgi:predicted GNAT family acetyltransferase